MAFALSYAGFAALSLAMNRHARDVLQRELPSTQRLALRIAGCGSLAMSLYLMITHTGWPVGVVEWFGMLTAGAVSFALLLSYLPRIAAALALGLPVLAAAASMLT
jgi:hypothetical protein